MANTSADHANRVLEILRTRRNAARVCELATGQVTPTVWRLADEPRSQKAPRPSGEG